MDEQEVKELIRPFMAKYGYECLTENGTVRKTLALFRRESQRYSMLYKREAKDYNELMRKLPPSWVTKMRTYDDDGNPMYTPREVLIVDDLFYGCDIIRYTFDGNTSPFQRSPRELPPSHIILEYKPFYMSGCSMRHAIGQALCYQIETMVPVYLAVPEYIYEYMEDVCNAIPIGMMVYDADGNISVAQNIVQKLLPMPKMSF